MCGITTRSIVPAALDGTGAWRSSEKDRDYTACLGGRPVSWKRPICEIDFRVSDSGPHARNARLGCRKIRRKPKKDPLSSHQPLRARYAVPKENYIGAREQEDPQDALQTTPQISVAKGVDDTDLAHFHPQHRPIANGTDTEAALHKDTRMRRS